MSAESWASSVGTRATMLANRRVDTKPERLLRSALHLRGLRFRKDLRLDLPDGRVRPDIAFTRAKVAIFVDGCFWHACPTHGTRPVINAEFWGAKLDRNVQRDRHQDRILEDAGWRVVRLWEHEDIPIAVSRVQTALTSPGQ